MIRLNFLKQHKNDILLILTLLLLAGGFWLWRTATQSEGSAIRITVDGQPYPTQPLNEDNILLLGTGGSCTLVIEDGAAYMASAICPDHVCIRRGKIRYDGETIVCLPNKVVVTVVGGEDNGFDAVSG